MGESFAIPDIPSQDIEKLIEITDDYLVAVTSMKHSQEGGYNDLRFTASGTLVSIGGKRAILTARHVVEAVEKEEPGDIRLLTNFRVGEPTPILSVDSRYVRFVKSTKPSSGDEIAGPDIALMFLPQQLAGSIAATKRFYNLDMRREAALQEEEPPSTGFWLARGFPFESVSSSTDTTNALCFYCLNHLGYLTQSHVTGGYDYYDLEFSFTWLESLTEPGDVPELKSNQGMSGGPLWHVKVFADSDGVPHVTGSPSDILLSGVAFYEFDMDEEMKKIRCHGSKSIYERLFDLVDQPTSG